MTVEGPTHGAFPLFLVTKPSLKANTDSDNREGKRVLVLKKWSTRMRKTIVHVLYVLANALGDQMNPTPASWDQHCASMGVDCTVACFAINPDF